MIRKALALTLVACLGVSPVYAQWPVIDNANLAQTVLIFQRTQRHLNELRAQYMTIMRMAQRLGRMDPYRTPPFALARHATGRWAFASPWITALNSGDPTGAGYLATALPLLGPDLANRLTGVARQAFERQYGNIEIADSVAMMGGHQVGLTREYHDELERAVRALEQDVLHPASSFHEMTAILDKVAAGELLGRRQEMAANQLLSHTLEQLLSRSKRMRDTEAASLNMQMVTWRDSEAVSRAFRAGAGDALRTWRQP